jgi:hypothetical protein
VVGIFVDDVVDVVDVVESADIDGSMIASASSSVRAVVR